jgi:hypothetical protein
MRAKGEHVLDELLLFVAPLTEEHDEANEMGEMMI